MVRLAFALLLSAPSVSAAVPAAPKATRPFEASVAEALGQAKAAAAQWTNVSLRVSGSGDSFYDVSDPWTGVNVSGTRSHDGYFSFSGWVGQEYLSFSANPYEPRNQAAGWSLWGSQVTVDVRPSGSGYRAWGSVGRQTFSATFNRWAGGWSVWGVNGANLSVSGFGGGHLASGQIDETRFDRKSLAVLGAVLAAVGSLPVPRAD